MTIKVAVASLNQTPLDWDNNQANIQTAINKAEKEGSRLLVLPELATTGYGCEDGFFMEGLVEESMLMLKDLHIPKNMYVVVGTPVEVNHRLYNGAAILCGRKIIGIALKQNLAINGIHYENRWFNAWKAGAVVDLDLSQFNFGQVPVGDIILESNGIRIGFEICEDAWVASRPGRSLFDRAVDVIVNPSASHFAIGKYETREQFVKEGSRAFGAAYLYANLNGCESGRAIFDGGNLIASNGEIIARGERLHYKDVSMTFANIDVNENRITQMNSSQRANIEDMNKNVVYGKQSIESKKNKYLPTSVMNPDFYQNTTTAWQFKSDFVEHEEATRAVALGLHHWLMKTHTNGFVLSLSGGADSGLVASAIYYMCVYSLEEMKSMSLMNNESFFTNFITKFLSKESTEEFLKDDTTTLDTAKEMVNNILTCVYQGSDNSGDVTLTAAREVANGIGAKFHNWSISELVKNYTDLVNNTSERDMNWEDDDIPLQNIQARVRAPGVWMIANRDNKLLLTTGNLSESAVGYMTMDGDTAGVLAPISGISKTRILEILNWMENTGTYVSEIHELPELSFINNQRPTAELRPEEQADEDDLMPFPVMDSIRRQAFMLRRRPRRILEQLRNDFDFEDEKLMEFINKFYTLFSRNQWKRDRSAPSFHIEMDSLDPKTYSRYPLLNGGWRRELEELNQ